MRKRGGHWWLLAGLIWLAGCTVNPVTGKKELSLVSEGQEIQIGAQNYSPSRQMQGGDYVLDPALSAYVNDVGQRLAAVSDRPLPYEFVVLNSSVPNAWALPGGKIAINRGLLLEMGSEAELAAVLGHEIVHAAARHGAKSMQRGMLLQGAVIGAAIGAGDSDYANLLVGGASVAAQLISQKYGRSAELESDEYGMKYMSGAGYDPQGAVELQETFVRLSEDRQQNQSWLAGLFASHPPSQERVDKNKMTAQSLPAGGETGEDQYQVRIAGLKRDKPAYDAYDEAHKALGEGKTKDALALVNKAIKIQPREGHFYSLRGDIRQEQGRYEDARTNYTSALNKNPEFFYYHLRRGLANEHLGSDVEARQDLESSVELLPTATAYNSLGNIARRGGDIEKAKEYYRAAAGSKSAVGKAALESLVVLDLPSNPGNYLSARTALDESGYLYVEVANPTPVGVTDVELAIRYLGNDGKVRQLNRRVSNTLGPEQRLQVATRLGPFTSANSYEVAIVGARVLRNN